MNIDEVMKQLELANREKLMEAHSSTGWVIYLADKGKNSCDKCLSNHGRKFKTSDLYLPQLPVHPNCRCRYEEIQPPESMTHNLHEKLKMQLGAQRSSILLASAEEPTLILPGNTRPQPKYYVDGKDFNAESRKKENPFGQILDKANYSAKQYSIYNLLKDKAYDVAVKRNFEFREKRSNLAYFDSSGIVTIGIGVNVEKNKEKLKEIAGFSEDKFTMLADLQKEYQKLILQLKYSTDSKTKKALMAKMKSLKKDVENYEIDNDKVDRIYARCYAEALAGARQAVNTGVWEKDKKGDMHWNAKLKDEGQFDALPVSVQVICIDMCFNAGVKGLEKYKLFLNAIKKKDYRRAAIELLDSKDYLKGPKGLKDRRMDAALDLMELQKEEERKISGKRIA